MALVLPGVNYRQLPYKSRTLLTPRIITVHTMVGYLNGTESYFKGSGRPYSHFGIGGNGEIRQWQDLRYRAASDYQGNPYSISIECEDHGLQFPKWSGSNVPAFSKAQVESLIVLLSWLCARFGIPSEAIRSSCPDQRGIGWHRFGIDPWRQHGCARWSTAYAKACPGNRRIYQMKNVIIPAVAVGGGKDKEDLDMDKKTFQKWVQDVTPDVNEMQLGIIQALHPDHQGNQVRVGDLDRHTQEQVKMLVAHELKPVVKQLEEIKSLLTGSDTPERQSD